MVKKWLEEQQQDANRLVLKLILLAMLKKTEEPEQMVAIAQNKTGLAELFDFVATNMAKIDVPEPVYITLDKWLKCLPIDPEILGRVYESMASGRRTKGVYYTPEDVVKFIMQHTVDQCDVVKSPWIKILDPACGCGYFLLAAYDLLFEKYTQNRQMLQEQYPDDDWSDEGIYRHILTFNLWGADIDETAAEVAAASLQLKQASTASFFKTNILCGDSLKNNADGKNTLARSFWQQSFDFVVGNPPYLSFGLRGTSRLMPDYEMYLRREYSASAEYKLSYYVLFMQKGLDMLVPGGKLGFIVPDSFLLGRYYSKIRRYIMEHAAIEVLAHVSSVVFKNASPGFSVVCVLNKEADEAVRMEQEVSVYRMEERQDITKALPATRCRQSYFASLPYQRFRIFFDEMSCRIVNKMDEQGIPLGNYLTGHSGIRSISKQSDVISSKCQGDTWQHGLISGRQINRYALLDEGHWINIEPQVLYKGGWYPEQVKVRKILMRQTGDTLTACIDEQGFYHLNNIHGFVVKDDSVTLDYLLMVLNSKLFAFYYHVVSMEYGRSMAQTDIETIELLPLLTHAEVNSQAPELVKAMENCVHKGLEGDAAAQAKAKTLDAFIDQLVYHIYSLSDAEISYLENYESRLCARTKRFTRNPLI